MFLRMLMWLVLAAAAWWFLRPRPKTPPAGARAAAASRAATGSGARAAAPPEVMVDCAHCGLHLPASETQRDATGRAFCCAAHLGAGPRREG